MATDTKIEWADKTWSPIIGCDRVSPGCHGCYAISQARIRTFNPHPKISQAFAGTVDVIDGRVDWTGQVNQLEDRLTQPLTWRKPAKIFVNSLSDLFHKNVDHDFIVKVFATMALTPQHTYQLLTKRHARMRTVLTDNCTCGNGHLPGFHFRSAMAWAVSKANPDRIPGVPDDAEQRINATAWPLPNLHLGVSVEDQHWADIRIPALLDTPAAVRWISAEPLLGPIRLSASWIPIPADFRTVQLADILGIARPERLDWVVAGGESGPKARPAHPDWFRSLRDQCAAADVRFLFKQWGEWGPAPFIVRVCDPETGWQGTDEELAAAKVDSEARGATHVHTGNWYDEDGERRYHLHEIGHKPWSLERVGLPEGTAAIRRWGKKRAGRELDGRTHDAFPESG
jgi:protein gp37